MCEYNDGAGDGDGGTLGLCVWQGTTKVLGETDDGPVKLMLKEGRSSSLQRWVGKSIF